MSQKQRILIVDDTPSNLKVLNDLLTDSYNISVTTNGPDTFKFLSSNNFPDLILLDVIMPGMDGFEVARILRADEKTVGIPIIFVTAKTDIESITKGFAIGGNDYIAKPIQPEELLARVMTHLELYEARKKLETVNQDLTIAVHKKTEQIREQNNALLILNKQLTREKEKAVASDRLKSEFLGQISHEIRTPLNHIIGMSQILVMDCESMDEEERDEILESIQEGGDRLTRTIELIMEVAQIKTGNYQMKLESIDMNQVVNDVIEQHKENADKKGLPMVMEPFPTPALVKGDRYSVTKIIDHLIDNAIKFTPQGCVNILCEPSGENHLSIVIKDTGLGMSPDYLKELFNHFSQEDHGTSRKFDGNGLGLALVKHCCDINNAQVMVESTKGSGTSFTVKF